MPTICHFEIPADEIGRAKNFYTQLFGWKVEKVGGPMEYWLISTTDEKGQDGVGGGMRKRGSPEQTITNYIDVPSVEEFAASVEKLGGRVVVPQTAVPGMGYFAVCLDTENNCFGLWETDEMAK